MKKESPQHPHEIKKLISLKDLIEEEINYESAFRNILEKPTIQLRL